MLSVSIYSLSEICFTAFEHPMLHNWETTEKDFGMKFKLKKID